VPNRAELHPLVYGTTTNNLDGGGGPTGPPKYKDQEPLAAPWGEAVPSTAGQPLQPEPDS